VSMFPLSIHVRAKATGYTQPSGLVGYWNFNEGSGTIAYDSSTYNDDGTIHGASWTNGKINGALSFDGVDDYIDCGNNEALDPTQGATIEAWVKFNQLPSDADHIMEIASRSGGGTDLDLQTETDNLFKFFIGPGAPNVAVSNTEADTSKWYHIAGTYEASSNIKIYVDGVLEDTVSTGVTRDANPNKFCIGQSGFWDGRFFNGTIDEVKIYDRALSAEEIEAEYISVSISPPSNAIDIGQSQQFTSTLSGGTSPYTYHWYLNGTAISGATSSTYTFTPTSRGRYNIYVNVTDDVGIETMSKTVTVTVNNAPSVTISPTSITMNVSQSQEFTSSVTEGTSPYTYQWYLNDAPVSDATSASWTFTPTTNGSYTVHLKLADSAGVSVVSSTANIEVSGSGEPQQILTLPLFVIVALLAVIAIVALFAIILYRRRFRTRQPPNK